MFAFLQTNHVNNIKHMIFYHRHLSVLVFFHISDHPADCKPFQKCNPIKLSTIWPTFPTMKGYYESV